VRQYVSGLCAVTLGLCAAGWLALAPVASGYRADRAGGALHRAAHQAALHRAALADWGTAAALGVVSLATLLAWIVAWRRRLRADGILASSARRRAWREARAQRRQERRREHDEVRAADVTELAAGPPDPARVLNELRALLVPLLDEAEAVRPDPYPDQEEPAHGEPARQEPLRQEPLRQEPPRPEAGHAEPVRGEPAVAAPAVPMPRPGGLAATESMLAGAELLMVAGGEEEAW
jgi:hypothetical protein